MISFNIIESMNYFKDDLKLLKQIKLTINTQQREEKPLKLDASRYLSVFIRIQSKLTFICSYLQIYLEIYRICVQLLNK